MEKLNLKAGNRNLTGKKVKKLRREGLVPANIFGKDIKSSSIQVKKIDLVKIWRKAGETTLVELSVEDGSAKPVFIKALQRDPKSGDVLHVDFQQVNLKEKITANVPLILDGESPIEKSGEGLILQTVSEVEVEALPTDIPHEIKIDSTKLTEVGQTVSVKDLKVDSKATILTDPEMVVVSVQSAEMKEEEPEVVAETAEPEVIAEKGEEEQSSEQTKEEETSQS